MKPDPASVAGIFSKEGLLFIARRLPGGDLGDKWEFPGGKLENGESPQMALRRELREEFGVDASIGDFLCDASFIHKGVKRTLYAYEFAFESMRFPFLESHSGWAWVDIEAISALEFAPSDSALLPGLKRALASKKGLSG